jgi:SAM-dependent methyltransferase
LQILEAGCGQSWELRLEGVHYFLTGVDLDQAALEIRKNILNDLDEIIQGDLRSVDLGDRKYDVIYNSYVLEHIQDAGAVLRRFLGWLKPNGLIIIRIPDPQSVQGFVTRISPHWLHVFYYRHILGKAAAGTPGHAPYQTFYDPVVSRSGIHEFCRANGLTIRAEVGNAYWRPGRGVLKPAIVLFKRLVSYLSLGALTWEYVDLLYVLETDGVARAKQ